MIYQPKICLVGDIVIDVSLKTSSTNLKMRLGGIVHAARALWALEIPYSVAYFAPSYLDDQIIDYLTSHGCVNVIKLGNVMGAPYVFLIDEVKEYKAQGYEFLLRNNISIEYAENADEKLNKHGFTDYLFISGNYNLANIINVVRGSVHIDLANNILDMSFFEVLNRKVDTIFLSTSSDIFRKLYENDFLVFADKFKNYTDNLILKENRGGSRGIDLRVGEIVKVPAQTKPIIHSVGVGDVYDIVFVNALQSKTFKEALNISSWVATEYAMTTYVDDFKLGVSRIVNCNLDDLINMKGVSLEWEKRKSINIYIAAPDFNFVDVEPIENIFESLEYHNFTPRRPIKENGQMENDASKNRRQEIFNKDMQLLDSCSILLAVLLYDDPGTLIEIGLAASRNIPTIVYDPYNRATNCMLTELPVLVSNDLDNIISEVFIQSNKLLS